MVKAVFPISINNQLLKSANFVKALNLVRTHYDEVVFVFFDQLQVYNHAVSITSGFDLSDLVGRSDRNAPFLSERRNWLLNLRRRLDSDLRDANWRILSVADVADGSCLAILRNIQIAFHTIPAFREDVERAARDYWVARDPQVSTVPLRLSELFILEEIAISVRLRVLEGIRDEYYAGKYLIPLLRVYSGFYGVEAHTLAGVPPNGAFRFFEISRKGLGQGWSAVDRTHHSPGAGDPRSNAVDGSTPAPLSGLV